MSEYVPTIDKLIALLRDSGLSQAQFVELCRVYGHKISTAKISVALSSGGFANHKVDQELRPLILKIEDLVERFAPLPVSFEDAARTKSIFELIDLGIDLGTRTNGSGSVTETSDNTTAKTSPNLHEGNSVDEDDGIISARQQHGFATDTGCRTSV